MLAFSPVGGPFLINTDAVHDQHHAAIAMDDNGDFVVAWQSYQQDGSSYGVYAQRYSADGVKQGGEFRVNSYTTNRQMSPAVAMDADGDFVIAWQSLYQDGSVYGVYAQRYNAAGVAQGGEFRVNTSTYDSQLSPSVAMDFNGNFVVTWQSFDQEGIYGQRYNSSGQAQGSQFKISTYTFGFQSSPAVALDADGDCVVTWESYGQDGSQDGIFARRYNAAGVAQGSEYRVNTYTTDMQQRPAVAMDADGDFVVSWESYGQDGSRMGIYGQRYNALGVAQGGEFRVNSYTTHIQEHVSVAMDDDGDFIVTWQSFGQDRSYLGIFAQRYNASGSAPEGEFQVNGYTTNDQAHPAIAMDAAGDFVIAFDSPLDIGNNNIYGQRYAINSPVNLSAEGLLTAVGTDLADTIDVSLASATLLQVALNGNNYSFDPTKVKGITLNGLGGNDQLSIGSSIAVAATLNGGDGKDRLSGGSGNDLLNGGIGDDTYLFDLDLVLGSDTIDESEGGVDTLDFSATTSKSVAVSLAIAAAQVVSSGRLSLTLSSGSTLENVIGGALADSLTGNALANALTGGSGDDSLNGGDGNDVYWFDSSTAIGVDQLSDTGGTYDRIDYSSSTLAVNLNVGITTLQTVNSFHQLKLLQGDSIEAVVGGRGNDTLRGNSLNNRLVGGGGNDVLVGGQGDDILIGGARNDRYFFNADSNLGSDTIIETADEAGGVDMLDFSTTTTTGVAIDLSKTTIQDVVAGKLKLTLGSPAAIEAVNGTALPDVINGNSLANILLGGSGNDQINAGAGMDLVIGGLGIDTLSGGDNDDLLISGRTSYDSNLPQFYLIQKVWVSNDTYANKVNKLRAGLGVPQLALGVTVFDDGGSNSLSGNTGRDWFFAQLAQISDRAGDEEIN